jgi:tRNA A-37 threonylcarbamoyl transferase component Bud32
MLARTIIYDFLKKLFYVKTEPIIQYKNDALYVQRNITSKISNWNSKFGKIKQRIGNNSANGAVFATDNPKYVVKIQPESQQAKEESLILKKLNGKNAPKFYNQYIIKVNNKSQTRKIFTTESPTNKLRLIVMEHLGSNVPNSKLMSLYKYYETKKGISLNNSNKIKAVIERVANQGILHGDLHMENIMVIVENGTNKLLFIKIIDFGRSKQPRVLRSGIRAVEKKMKEQMVKGQRTSPNSILQYPNHFFSSNGSSYLPINKTLSNINELRFYEN